MSKAGKLVKDLVKAKKESVMGKLANGDDPMEPWSKRFDAPIKEDEQLNESDPLLFKYIRSLGWEPKHMDFATRSKYARSNAFKNFKVGHTSDPKDRMDESENLDEAGTGLLMSYIKAKGLDPRLMDGNQKASYSRSSEFQKFKNRHVKETSGMGERGDDWNEEKKPKAKKVQEAVDEKDTVTMDIPLLIRVLEYAREDAKTDMDLHKVVENLINMRGHGALSMDMYNKIVAIKEEIEKIDELSKGTLTSYATKARADASNLSKQGDAASKRTSSKSMQTALDKFRKAAKRNIGAAGAESKARVKEEVEQIDELKKQNDNMEIDDRITREEKKMKGADPCWKGYQMVGTKKKGGRTVPNCVPEETEITEGIYGIQDSPLSATNSVKAMESTGRKKQMTKSARMIKSIYKKKNVKETIYDWEKSEKGGKVVDEPTAKIIMKGGTTMTGKPRDTIEIGPVLRTKLNSPAGNKPSV
jgi:hypothetical protein